MSGRELRYRGSHPEVSFYRETGSRTGCRDYSASVHVAVSPAAGMGTDYDPNNCIMTEYVNIRMSELLYSGRDSSCFDYVAARDLIQDGVKLIVCAGSAMHGYDDSPTRSGGK